jgi:prefoldin alpha subunit
VTQPVVALVESPRATTERSEGGGLGKGRYFPLAAGFKDMSLGGGGQQQLQQLSQEIQAIEEEIEELEGDVATLRQEKAEIEEAKEALDVLETGSTVQVPLGGDAYVRAEVEDIDEVVVSLGGGYAAEQSSDDAADVLDEKKETLDERIGDVQGEISELDDEASQLEQQAQQAQQQMMQQQMQAQQQGQPPQDDE